VHADELGLHSERAPARRSGTASGGRPRLPAERTS
jgi:hypothetical protein